MKFGLSVSNQHTLASVIIFPLWFIITRGPMSPRHPLQIGDNYIVGRQNPIMEWLIEVVFFIGNAERDVYSSSKPSLVTSPVETTQVYVLCCAKCCKWHATSGSGAKFPQGMWGWHQGPLRELSGQSEDIHLSLEKYRAVRCSTDTQDSLSCGCGDNLEEDIKRTRKRFGSMAFRLYDVSSD